jgi:hypothetical protein
MSVIAGLNSFMPTLLNKNTEEYIAIFGNEVFSRQADIVDSADFNCGAIANEMEFSVGFCEYVTKTRNIDNYYGEYLDRIIYYFTGFVRDPLGVESDASFRNRFKAVAVRALNPSWLTTWSIRDVFSYFFPLSIIYVTENYVLDEFFTDGSFEVDPALNWVVVNSGASATSFVTHDMFYGTACAEVSIDSSGSACSIAQTIASVPIGKYLLSFFTKDDRLLPTSDLFKVIAQRASDSFYYNFDTQTWQALATSKTVVKNVGTRYESQQLFVDVPGIDNITIKFENVGGTSVAYKYYLDKITFGTFLPYPTLKLVLVDENLGDVFMNLWSGTADPIALLDYTKAGYIEQGYISGFGGEGLLPYYQTLLSIVKPAGVNSMIEVVWRSHA